MGKEFRVLVFGKEGCDKCKTLNNRIDSLLQKEEWGAFEKVYMDVGTEDGIVSFCQMECLNPQRIPAMVVARRDPETGDYMPVANASPQQDDPVCRNSRLYTHVGLQTDYNANGVISKKMIQAVLQEAADA